MYGFCLQEVIERRRRERLQGPGSPQRGGRSVLVDDFGNAIDSDMESGPQVVRVHDPDTSGQTGRVYRAGSARPTRPLVTAPQRPASAHPAVRPAQVRRKGGKGKHVVICERAHCRTAWPARQFGPLSNVSRRLVPLRVSTASAATTVSVTTGGGP